MLLNLSKFSWRSRIQGVRRPPVLATASMMRLVRWQCTVLSFLSPLFYLYIDYKMPPKPFQVPLFCPLCEVPAPVRKVTVRGLCELSIFDKWSHSILVSIDHVQGCTTTSSERMGSRCTLDIGTLFSTTTPASPPGFGTTGRTTEVWRSAFLRRRLSF